MAVPMVSSAKRVTFGCFQRRVASLLTCSLFAWQAWHFVTFQHVSWHVKSRFVWQAQYFCDVSRRCDAVFVAGAGSTLETSDVILLGRCSTFNVSGSVFFRLALSGLREVVTRCEFRGSSGIFWHVMKTDGSLARNATFEVGPKENPW